MEKHLSPLVSAALGGGKGRIIVAMEDMGFGQDNIKAHVQNCQDNTKAQVQYCKDNIKAQVQNCHDNTKVQVQNGNDNTKAQVQNGHDNTKAQAKNIAGSSKQSDKIAGSPGRAARLKELLDLLRAELLS
ncbi:hypothetical protein GUJ93_ZPchr0007g3784 [Zizania palustris]|uniref:Uncharacterized protein n=1 Tax=Zizania palustris TaxID=103762 RepID=A0A8J5T504_ZIZPA|nr:hypothetical protein GUJ93_ZPchr0007g3784 [Zizania palustris]